MKHLARLLAAALIWILLLNLVACTEPAEEKDPGTQPTEPQLSATEIYNTAKEAFLSAPHRILTYAMSKHRTIAGQTYSEQTAGTASFSDYGKDTMIAVVEEDIRYGTVTGEHLLSFCNGRAYSRISGCTFGADMTVQEFIETQLPAAILNEALYENIALTRNADGYVITFSEPQGLETWVPQVDSAQLTSASGTATVNAAGTLVETSYQAEYIYEGLPFSLDMTMQYATPAQLELSALHPEHPDDYVILSCLEAPKLLLRSAGDIFASKVISATAEETIYSQIIPLTRQKVSQMYLSGAADTLSAKLSNAITIRDYRDQPNTTNQSYLFENGVCTGSVDGGTPTIQAGITAENMRTSIEDSILSALFATRYLFDATMTDDGDVYRLDFAGNQAYCSDLIRDLSAFLNLSLEGATSYKDTQASGYLCIDKVTGLPVAMGMYFTRTHMFGEIPYVLSYQLDQTIALSPAE